MTKLSNDSLSVKITKHLFPTQQELEILNAKFHEFVVSKFPGLPDESEDRGFLFSAYDQERFVGGISGNVYWDGLEIDTLWVDRDMRRKGLGRQLLAMAENFARENGAVIAFLKTVDAQYFYEKNGYLVYGRLEDRPIGSVLLHMKKRLDKA